ncbi:MAG: NAD-dependent epimerase/dehydratase family protein [Pannonibacter sp.]
MMQTSATPDTSTSASETIVVFGGSGFIGSHLIRTLQARGADKIVSVDRRPPKTRLNNVTYIDGDVRDLSAFDVSGPVATIYNLAAVHTTPGHPTHEYYETNVAGASQITAFARRKGVREIVFTSSISVYGPGEETKSESSVPAPESAYGWSKWLAEGIHRDWLQEQEDRRLVICRPAVIFGPGEGGNFTRLAKLMKKGLFVYPGRKDTIKACFYVDDLVDSLLYAKGLGRPYVLFNGCYSDRYTLEQIVDTFRSQHFPKVRTFMIPLWVVLGAAKALRPFSMLGLGIHPDRVMKLVRSTDIVPNWLEAEGKSAPGRLPSAFERWSTGSDGAFI